jgi:hypothetical protein
MSARNLAGTTAIVTGASRGFGRATAIALAELGAHVVGVARNKELLDRLAGQLGDRFTPEIADGADPSLPARLIPRDRPQTLVLNAGASPTPATVSEQTWEAGWRCSPNNQAGSPCTQDVTVAGPGAMTMPFTVTVASSLPAGTTEIVNTVTSSEGTCSVCTVRNPTVASPPTPTSTPTPAGPTPSQAATAPLSPAQVASQAAPASAPPSTGPSGPLALTGFLLSKFLWLAAALLGTGTGLVLIARRERAIPRR